jgi:hypothetical protein
VEHPKKVLCISLVADDQPAEVLQPGKQSFKLPAAPIPPHAPKILGFVSSIASVGSDQFDSVEPELCVQLVGVIGVVTDQVLHTEISPSGTGLHIWVKGNLPEGRHRVGRMEMYDNTSPRYMTLAGSTATTLKSVRLTSPTYIARCVTELTHRQRVRSGRMRRRNTLLLKTCGRNCLRGTGSPTTIAKSQADLAYCTIRRRV